MDAVASNTVVELLRREEDIEAIGEKARLLAANKAVNSEIIISVFIVCFVFASLLNGMGRVIRIETLLNELMGRRMV